MGRARVAVVATWQGWCGACAGERPLVLTRAGRRTLRSWRSGLGDDHLPLTLTCRLCGVGVDVPLHEEDDVDPVEVEAVAAVAEPPVAPEPVVPAPVAVDRTVTADEPQATAVAEQAVAAELTVVPEQTVVSEQAVVSEPTAVPDEPLSHQEHAPADPVAEPAAPAAGTDVLTQARAALAARRIAAEEAERLQAARSCVAGALAALVAQRAAEDVYPGDLTSDEALHLLSGGIDALPAAATG